MRHKTLLLSAAAGILFATCPAWAVMTKASAKALAITAYHHQASERGAAALEKLERAANAGVPVAQDWLGLFYHASTSYAKANYWFKKAAEQGYADAQYNLGVDYDNGEGVPENHVKAVYWYKSAAEQGYAPAQYNLGFDYYSGEGVPKNYVKANYWFKKVAEQGDAAAQNHLGLSYDNGEGVPKNYVKANYWFKKAAEQGFADAQYNLGLDYDNGEGVPKNYVKANYWYKKAAEQGNADAQINLGLDYYNGHGMPQDSMRAIYWWKKAAAHGSNLARKDIRIAEGANASNRDGAQTVTYTQTCNNADCVRRYSDGRVVRYTACINPADGLPMDDPNQPGGCGGTDSDGNVYGVGN